MKIAVLLLMLSFLSGCEILDPQSTTTPAPAVSPKIELPEITDGSCLNLQRLLEKMSAPGFNFPGTSVTTKLDFLSEVDDRDTRFFSYTLFKFKRAPVNQLFPWTQAVQLDCDKLVVPSASKRNQHFKIAESSEGLLSFKLIEVGEEDLSELQKTTFLSRIQPFSFEITYLSNTSFQIRSKFKTFDPICNRRRILTIEKTEIISWAELENSLPLTYELDKKLIAAFERSVSVPVDLTEQPILKVTQLEQMQRAPILEELNVCAVR